MHTFRHEAHGDVFLDDEVVGGGSGSVGGGAAPGGDNQRTRASTQRLWGCTGPSLGAHTSGGRAGVEVQQLGVRLMVRL